MKESDFSTLASKLRFWSIFPDRRSKLFNSLMSPILLYNCEIWVAFLLANLNPDSAIKNSMFCSIKDQTNLRLQLFRLVSQSGIFVPFNETAFRSQNMLVHQ